MTHRSGHTIQQVMAGITAAQYDASFPPPPGGEGDALGRIIEEAFNPPPDDGDPTGTAFNLPGLSFDKVTRRYYDTRTGELATPEQIDAAIAREQATAGSTSSPAALRNAQTAADRLRFDIEQAGVLSPAQIAQIELNQEQLQQRIAESDQDAATAAQNLTFLRDKLASEVSRDDRSAVLATRSLMESITARMERTQLERQGLIQQAQGLQAQLTQQAAIANQAATAQAEQINEQRRQFNLSQQRGVATDIAEAAVSPGDVGRQAALLLAGTGGSPFSTALAEGEDFRTPQSLQGLDLLLGTRAELAHGPEQFNPMLISAPNVPIPSFAPIQAPDFSQFFQNLMAPRSLPPQLRLPAPQPLSETLGPIGPTTNRTEDQFFGLLAEGERALDADFDFEIVNGTLTAIPKAAHGGTYRNRASAAHGGTFLNDQIARDPLRGRAALRSRGVVDVESRPVDTEQVIVGEPAPDGSARPELLRLAPGAEVDVQPLTDDAGRPLGGPEGFLNAQIARGRAVPGVTLPAQASDRAREAVTAAGVTGELRLPIASRPIMPGPEQLEPVGRPVDFLNDLMARDPLRNRRQPVGAAHGGGSPQENLVFERGLSPEQEAIQAELDAAKRAGLEPNSQFQEIDLGDRPDFGILDDATRTFLRQRVARAAHGGTFTNELLAGPGSTQVESGINFLDRAFRLAMSRLPFKRLPLPVELATPGMSPFVQQAAASVAALGRGVNPEEFLAETRRLTPRGISAAPQRRTA